jgi:hypothetical protein
VRLPNSGPVENPTARASVSVEKENVIKFREPVRMKFSVLSPSDESKRNPHGRDKSW